MIDVSDRPGYRAQRHYSLEKRADLIFEWWKEGDQEWGRWRYDDGLPLPPLVVDAALFFGDVSPQSHACPVPGQGVVRP